MPRGGVWMPPRVFKPGRIGNEACFLFTQVGYTKKLAISGDIRPEVDLIKFPWKVNGSRLYVLKVRPMGERLAHVARRDGGLSKPALSSKTISLTLN